MELKEWTYEEFPEFTDEVPGAKWIDTTGDEVGVYYLNDIGHVRREGGKRLLNALLVAYIHQNTAENAELAVVGAGHQKSAHSH